MCPDKPMLRMAEGASWKRSIVFESAWHSFDILDGSLDRPQHQRPIEIYGQDF